ncbi:MAG: hypothetical protein ACI89D_002624 [Bermanella sp.]|jgi:hypothetical protein
MWVEPTLPPMQALLAHLLESAGLESMVSLPRAWWQPLGKQLQSFLRLRDPSGVYAFCTDCTAP